MMYKHKNKLLVMVLGQMTFHYLEQPIHQYVLLLLALK